MGFLQENTPVSELPLLISFEAKSLGMYFIDSAIQIALTLENYRSYLSIYRGRKI